MRKIHGIQSIFLKYVLILLMIAMALSGIGNGILLSRSVNRDIVSKYTYMNDRIAVLMENEYAKTDAVMKRCLESREIQDSLLNRELSRIEKEKLAMTLSYMDLKYLENYIYVDNKENLYLQAYRNTTYDKIDESGLQEALGDRYSQTRWIWMDDRIFGREGKYLFIGRYMRNMEYHHDPGMLFFQMNEGFFQNILKDVPQEDGICMILDTNGEICSRNHAKNNGLTEEQEQQLQKEMQEHFARGVQEARFQRKGLGTVIYRTVLESEFTAVTLIPDAVLSEVIVRNVRLLSGVYLVVAAVALVCSVYFSRKFTRPVKEISTAVKEFGGGDFSKELHIHTDTELDTIGNAFNSMVKNISQLVQEVKENERALRKSELNSLMYQINPHFLYNTLDTIYMLARINGEEITMKMIQALSKFMKVSLSKGSDEIPVADELEHVKSYMEIQKIRNNDLFQYEIFCEEKLKKVPVLKLILQPLVENAIKHGFARIYQDGRIVIRVMQEGEDLVFHVANNGAVMDPETIELIRMMAKEDISSVRRAFQGQENGYGIGNVISRLRLKYEDQITFYYKSDEEETCCVIRIPMQGLYEGC